MMLLTKVPVPVPSLVLLPAMVGLAVVAQHTPRAVIAPPPSAVMVPPLVAVVLAKDVIAAVVRTGSAVSVVNEILFPYAVPAELVAYALM